MSHNYFSPKSNIPTRKRLLKWEYYISYLLYPQMEWLLWNQIIKKKQLRKVIHRNHTCKFIWKRYNFKLPSLPLVILFLSRLIDLSGFILTKSFADKTFWLFSFPSTILDLKNKKQQSQGWAFTDIHFKAVLSKSIRIFLLIQI